MGTFLFYFIRKKHVIQAIVAATSNASILTQTPDLISLIIPPVVSLYLASSKNSPSSLLAISTDFRSPYSAPSTLRPLSSISLQPNPIPPPSTNSSYIPDCLRILQSVTAACSLDQIKSLIHVLSLSCLDINNSCDTSLLQVLFHDGVFCKIKPQHMYFILFLQNI